MQRAPAPRLPQPGSTPCTSTTRVKRSEHRRESREADSIPPTLTSHHPSPREPGRLKDPGEIKEAAGCNPTAGSLRGQAGSTALRRLPCVSTGSQQTPPASPGFPSFK